MFTIISKTGDKIKVDETYCKLSKLITEMRDESPDENANIPVEFENETLTTMQAKRFSEDERKIHSSAAALILQSYLDKSRNK